MDSLTQIVLGSTVAALAVPAAHRRKALLAGALLGTLPDLDTIPLALIDPDPVARMVLHRSATHSLLVLPFIGLLIWWLLRWRWPPVRQAPTAWLIAIQLALLTHPLLDAFTVYGTQLLWPFPAVPAMWASLWIIDPGYTLPLLAGCVAAIIYGPARKGTLWLAGGLLLSSAYLAWSLVAKHMVERDAQSALTELGLQDAPRFSIPLPMNTLVWQVVAMTPDGYLIGERSLLADRKPIQFRHYDSASQALAQASATIPALQRLQWFNRGFMRADIDDDQRLVVADLRMGQEPDYVFQFGVARQEDGQWVAIRPERVETPMRVLEQLPGVWQRLWNEP